jgi:hypothetical protein
MLPVLRRFLDMFGELAVRHGQSLLAAYADILHQAQALLRKIDEGQQKEGRATTEPPSAETQNVMDFPHHNGTVAPA